MRRNRKIKLNVQLGNREVGKTKTTKYNSELEDNQEANSVSLRNENYINPKPEEL